MCDISGSMLSLSDDDDDDDDDDVLSILSS